LGDRGVTLSHTTTIAGWIVIAIFTAVVVLLPRVPSFATMLRSRARSTVVRVILLLAWAWIGWHFFVRTSR
jgi:Family of unknown function (DUF6186)